MRISTVIITKNEEKNIQKCIESVLSFSSEIIVVDSFSTDNTKSIATKYSVVKFYERVFDGYIAQKNYANSLATGDFIWSIDADEWCSDELVQYFQSLIEIDYEILEIKRVNYYRGQAIQYGLWSNDRKKRFWKRGIATWGGATPHEDIIFSDGVIINRSSKVLFHNAYNSHSDFLYKSLKYAELAAIELSEKNYPQLYLSVFINPIFKFVKGYVFKFGFLDGLSGVFIAVITMLETFYKYILAIKLKWQKN